MTDAHALNQKLGYALLAIGILAWLVELSHLLWGLTLPDHVETGLVVMGILWPWFGIKGILRDNKLRMR